MSLEGNADRQSGDGETRIQGDGDTFPRVAPRFLGTEA